MNEIITAGGVEYIAQSIKTGINTISFKLSGLTADEAREAFKNIDSLTVGSGGEDVYGEYPDVKFSSVTLEADDSIIVTMHIPSDIEKQIREVQKTQKEMQASLRDHDEVIAELLYGGEL